ncbi:IpaD/SipD/SspD family type III secretion system needle tip protein [Pseudomonas sp. NPDC086251]|uniref:IpaD/SipD/SspD family type III secretion system needle tip protein n=1 Tax=Pseudomonas sp. NPDC086251 TaxID=3364431 RepID=UPI0038391A4F
MEIIKFTAMPAQSLATIKVVTDVPSAVETPPEVHTAFSMAQILDRSMQTLNRDLANLLKVQFNVAEATDRLIAGGSAQVFAAELAEKTEARATRHLMYVHRMKQCAEVFQHCADTLPVERQRELEKEKNQILERLVLTDVPLEIEEEFHAELKSSNDFFDKLLELIDLIKNGYLDGYEHILKAYSDFFADFNKDITAMLKEWIEGVDDGKNVEVDGGAIRSALFNLIARYSYPNPASILFPKPGEGGASKEEAEKWRIALGLPESCLKENPDGTYCVVIDTGPLTIMAESLPEGGKVKWDTARFQAWQTGFNAQEERMKNMLQSLTQKYSNANSYHDNFNKTLSSHLNQYADMLKAMLNF